MKPVAGAATLFSEDIDAARDRFLAACERIGLRVVSHPARVSTRVSTRVSGGPSGLCCDVTRLGSPEADRAVVLCSGAAGPAGLLGCAAALNIVAGDGIRDLPRNVALVLIHAANPKGPVWPGFAAGEETRAAAPPPDWSDGVLAAAERRFAEYQTKSGTDWRALSGRTLASMAPPAWGGDVLRAVAADQLKDAARVCVVDPRTGPGRFGGHALISCDARHSAARDRAEAWFAIDAAAAAEAVGTAGAPCGGGIGGLAKSAQVTNVLVEVGTYSMAGVLSGARRDAASAYPLAQTWRVSAWEALRATLRRAYAGLQRDD